MQVSYRHQPEEDLYPFLASDGLTLALVPQSSFAKCYSWNHNSFILSTLTITCIFTGLSTHPTRLFACQSLYDHYVRVWDARACLQVSNVQRECITSPKPSQSGTQLYEFFTLQSRQRAAQTRACLVSLLTHVQYLHRHSSLRFFALFPSSIYSRRQDSRQENNCKVETGLPLTSQQTCL